MALMEEILLAMVVFLN